jgi:hypothetical protein
MSSSSSPIPSNLLIKIASVAGHSLVFVSQSSGSSNVYPSDLVAALVEQPEFDSPISPPPSDSEALNKYETSNTLKVKRFDLEEAHIELTDLHNLYEFDTRSELFEWLKEHAPERLDQKDIELAVEFDKSKEMKGLVTEVVENALEVKSLKNTGVITPSPDRQKLIVTLRSPRKRPVNPFPPASSDEELLDAMPIRKPQSFFKDNPAISRVLATDAPKPFRKSKILESDDAETFSDSPKPNSRFIDSPATVENEVSHIYPEIVLQLDCLRNDEFVESLYKFMIKKQRPIQKAPSLGYQTLDLFKLYKSVVSRGGMDEVTRLQAWKSIYQDLGIPTMSTSASYNTRTNYKKFLYLYELEHFDPQTRKLISQNTRDQTDIDSKNTFQFDMDSFVRIRAEDNSIYFGKIISQLKRTINLYYIQYNGWSSSHDEWVLETSLEPLLPDEMNCVENAIKLSSNGSPNKKLLSKLSNPAPNRSSKTNRIVELNDVQYYLYEGTAGAIGAPFRTSSTAATAGYNSSDDAPFSEGSPLKLPPRTRGPSKVNSRVSRRDSFSSEDADINIDADSDSEIENKFEIARSSPVTKQKSKRGRSSDVTSNSLEYKELMKNGRKRRLVNQCRTPFEFIQHDNPNPAENFDWLDVTLSPPRPLNDIVSYDDECEGYYPRSISHPCENSVSIDNVLRKQTTVCNGSSSVSVKIPKEWCCDWLKESEGDHILKSFYGLQLFSFDPEKSVTLSRNALRFAATRKGCCLPLEKNSRNNFCSSPIEMKAVPHITVDPKVISKFREVSDIKASITRHDTIVQQTKRPKLYINVRVDSPSVVKSCLMTLSTKSSPGSTSEIQSCPKFMPVPYRFSNGIQNSSILSNKDEILNNQRDVKNMLHRKRQELTKDFLKIHDLSGNTKKSPSDASESSMSVSVSGYGSLKEMLSNPTTKIVGLLPENMEYEGRISILAGTSYKPTQLCFSLHETLPCSCNRAVVQRSLPPF